MVRCIIVLFLCLWAPYTESREKIDKDKCRHMTSAGLIDLNLLAHDDNTPRFKDVQDEQQSFGYSWNPCSPFNEDNCQGVEVCQVDMVDPSQDYVLGRTGTSQFIEQPGALFLNYRTESPDGVRETYIQLICNKDVDGELVFNEENPPLTYHLTLTSRYACPMSMTTPPPPTVTPTHPSPRPHIFNLKTITILLACILVSLCIVNCMVFLGLITRSSGKRRNNTSTGHINQAFEKKPLP